MARRWQQGQNSAASDDSGITFDLSGTPMDQEWRCSFEALSGVVNVLRQTWPEEVVREMFEEAARHSASVVLPPVRPAAPTTPAKPKARSRKKQPPEPPLPPTPVLN